MENQTEKVIMSYSLKYIFCKRPNCLTCSTGKGHGPYWHVSFELNGETQTLFLGKELKPFELTDRIIESLSSSSRRESIDNPQKSATRNTTFNGFTPPQKEHTTDERFTKHKNTTAKPTPFRSPPSRRDFERDLILLNSAYQLKQLKTIYRGLIKKYHPDQFPENRTLNAWMAEINGQYQQRRKTASLH